MSKDRVQKTRASEGQGWRVWESLKSTGRESLEGEEALGRRRMSKWEEKFSRCHTNSSSLAFSKGLDII